MAYCLIIALVAIAVIAILVLMGPQIGQIFSTITNGLYRWVLLNIRKAVIWLRTPLQDLCHLSDVADFERNKVGRLPFH